MPEHHVKRVYQNCVQEIVARAKAVALARAMSRDEEKGSDAALDDDRV